MVQQESRVKKSLLNARVNLIFYFLTLALSFFSRKIFLDTLGADFVGLTGTLQNLLGFLNLAELGIGSAIGYVLYKPLFYHDEVKINEIISVFGYLYRWIGWIILIAGCILACFLPLIFPNTEFDLALIFFAYFSFLASSLIGYFANYKQTLLGADQKNYVVTAYFQTASIIKTIIQMASAYYTGNYYVWVVIELLFGIIYSCILNWKINQVYPWLKSEVRQGKLLFKKYPEVMKYTKQLFMHKIGGFVQYQTAPFLIYIFVSLKIVAFYGNYAVLIEKLSLLVNNILGSTSAGVGHLVAEGDRNKILNVYNELYSIRFFVAGIVCSSVYFFINPFIVLWLGKEYILDQSILILLVINALMGYVRGTTEQFLYAYGLFSDIYSPLCEIIIYMCVAIVGGSMLGLAGVLLGSIVSQYTVIGIWKPYFLFSKGFKIKVLYYWQLYFTHLFVILCAGLGCYYILDRIQEIDACRSYFAWMLICFSFVCLYAFISFILFYLFTFGMRKITHRFIRKIRIK